MQFLVDLWMPIVVSAVLVWITSFITHMVLPFHKSEFVKLPDEDAFLGEVNKVEPGLYMFPCTSYENMNSPEFTEKMAQNRNGIIAIWPGPVNMGRNLIMTLMFYVVVGVFVAYLGSHSIVAEHDYLHRFRICGTIAFAAHGLGWMSFFIWYRYGRFWPNFIDAVAYALVTAGTFAWLWPKK